MNDKKLDMNSLLNSLEEAYNQFKLGGLNGGLSSMNEFKVPVLNEEEDAGEEENFLGHEVD
jgi:hypothetical protein